MDKGKIILLNGVSSSGNQHLGSRCKIRFLRNIFFFHKMDSAKLGRTNIGKKMVTAFT